MTRILLTILMTTAVACTGEINAGDMPAGSPEPVPGESGSGEPEGTPDPEIDDDVEPDPVVDGKLTYHRDIRPLLEEHCVGCHEPGGIGTFPLNDYASVTAVSALVRQSVDRLEMPPWPPAEGCGDFRHERRMSASEVAAVVDWVDDGAPEGEPADYMAPQVGSIPDLGDPDLTVQMPAPYEPTPREGGTDDFRCFVLPLELGEPRSLTGWEFVPSNREVAHHALFWVLPNTSETSAYLADLEAADAGPGYSCFGGSRVPSAAAVPLGAWTPGDVPAIMAPGVGFSLPASGFLVLQMHYNTANDGGSDQSSVNLKFSDEPVDTELRMEIIGDYNLDIPAGAPMVEEGSVFTSPASVNVYGFLPHMHQLGTRIRLRVDDRCLIDVPEWDFNWQGTYYLEEPITIPAGAKVEVECWYDNSMQNQPDGRSPVDVSFGEGSFDEMCLVGVVVGGG